MSPSRIQRFSSPLKKGITAATVALSVFLFFSDTACGTLIVRVNATDGSDSGSWAANWPIPTDPYTWDLSSPFNIYSSSNPLLLLGTVTQLSVTLDTDPSVALAFHVEAGAAPTVFTITSSTVSFPTLVNAQAFATAIITVTDLDGSAGGATLTGLFPGSKAYEAQYNASSVFADLVSPINALSDDSNFGSQRLPAVGRIPILGSVSSIHTQFSFSLTANDAASGTSRFDVVPEPSSLALALLGGAALLWRVRRRK